MPYTAGVKKPPSLLPDPATGTPPLAERVRPRTLEEIVGQDHLLGPDGPLRKLIESRRPASMILWGPPGTGKTTLARLIGAVLDAEVLEFSAVMMGVKDIREAVESAHATTRQTVLFVDEIHRLNKAQQDAFLPHVEAGTFVLIGATTENPSFSVIAPLLSRSRVFVLETLSPESLRTIVTQALADKRGYGGRVTLAEDATDFLDRAAGGDARSALGAVEFAVVQKGLSEQGIGEVTRADLEQALQRRLPAYDKTGEHHYNVISAFIKSMRGSDPDAALYYLARMIDAGEDARFIARRMVILASEDVGNADPHALTLAVAAANAVEFVGLPEAELNLAQVVVYLSLAPKSNASYEALLAAHEAVRGTPDAPVPMNLRNAPTRLMKDLGYHKGYQYDHAQEGAISNQRFLPDVIEGGFYVPTEYGAEAKLKARWEEIKKRRQG